MTELQQDFNENVNEKKNQEIKTESTIPVSDKAHDNEVGRLVPLSSVSTPNKSDTNSESEEMTNNVDNQTKLPNALNELIVGEQNSSNFSAISNDDKQTSSPNISIISNEDRQFNPSTILNNSSPTISNEPNNDKQNSSSNTLNDSSDDKQNSLVISNDDNDNSSSNFNDNEQTIFPNILNEDNDKKSSSPNIFNDDKQTISPNIPNDDDDKQTSSPSIFNDDKQTSSPNIFNDDKQTSSPNISNDVKQITQPISPISNDDKKTNSTISPISIDDKKTNSPTISSISNDDKKINSPTISPISNDDKNNSPSASPISNDDEKINSSTTSPISNDDEKINSSTTSPVSNDDEKINSSTTSPISNKLYDNKQDQTTSNEYLDDNLEESIHPSDTNKDSSNSEDDISSNAIMSGSEIQEEGYEIVKPADSIEDSKHEINDIDYSFIKEHDNLTESIVEDPSKHKPNDDDINMNNENKFSDFVEKLNNNEIVESTSDDDDEYYDDDDDDDSHNEPEYIERKEDHETKEEENQLPITFKPDSYYNSYIEPKKNEVQVADQQIRERRRPNQQHQELSSPSENIILKNSNVRTDTRHPSISFLKIFRNIFSLIMFFAFIYFIYDVIRLSKMPSSLENIADITDNIFEEINSVELPAINTISDYTVECRIAAITVERSAPFKSYGSQIAKGLQQIGESILKSRELLQYAYSKGSTLRSSFESEIDAILQRLNSKNHIRQDDAKYIRDRLDKVTKKIKDIRVLVEKSHNSILDIRQIRIKMDDDITNGFKDAEKYNKNEKYSSVINKAKKELENVDNMLSKLYINVGHLEKLREILNDYGGKLMGVLDELDELGDKGARILKDDIKRLRLAVENTKVRNHIFNRLANTD